MVSMPADKAPPVFAYLDTLNPAQRQAVETLDGPLLVLAGAGTGKTRVLTTRIAHLLNTGRAYPSQILAVTFTNKAAQEMKERVSQLMGGAEVSGWAMGTFHALASRMLRKHADLAGLQSNFTILDPDDQIRLFKQIIEESGLDTKKHTPKSMIVQIDRWKDRGLVPSQVSPEMAGEALGGRLPELYHTYQQRLRMINACDFGDLLLHMITIFKNPEYRYVLEEYHQRCRYILVDEYQDTNVAQYQWLRLLAQGSGNLCCVGDDDQSIYGWRGAEVENILRFEKDFPGAKVIRLEDNYRSTDTILAAADKVIANNAARLGKTLRAVSGQGESIKVRGFYDSKSEAAWVGEETEQLQRAGESLGQMAILVRAGAQTREFEERFIQLGIPYQVIGGTRFYERREIRDALAYLRVIAQPHDDLALERIINVPSRKIGTTTVQKLHTFARQTGQPLSLAIDQIVQTDELNRGLRQRLTDFMADFKRWRQALNSGLDQAELLAMVLEESGYLRMWEEDKSPQAQGRVENLGELATAMTEYDTLDEFLEHVALVFDAQEEGLQDKISIMTLHGAKGLEFDAVFLPGWEEGIFPSQRALNEKGLKALEEERRLAYVGLTRARKRVFISFAANRFMYGNWTASVPSRFIEELPPDTVEAKSEMGLIEPGYERLARNRHMDSSIRSHRNGPQRVKSQAGDTFERGERVFHQKFGYGKILNISGHKLDIAFEKSGPKLVMDSFVEKV